MPPKAPIWAIEEQQSLRAEEASCPTQESCGCRPWCDVDHIDAKHGIRAMHGPGLRAPIKVQRMAKLRRAVPRSTPEWTLAFVGQDRSLPSKVWERLRKVNDVLARPARGLEHQAIPWQDPPENLKDGVLCFAQRRGHRVRCRTWLCKRPFLIGRIT